MRRSYVDLETETRRHESVRPSVEGVWSLFKRSIVGSFHKMRVKHMDRYLEELEWRFNNRDNPQIFVDTLRRIVNTDLLEYRALVSSLSPFRLASSFSTRLRRQSTCSRSS